MWGLDVRVRAGAVGKVVAVSRMDMVGTGADLMDDKSQGSKAGDEKECQQ